MGVIVKDVGCVEEVRKNLDVGEDVCKGKTLGWGRREGWGRRACRGRLVGGEVVDVQKPWALELMLTERNAAT